VRLADQCNRRWCQCSLMRAMGGLLIRQALSSGRRAGAGIVRIMRATLGDHMAPHWLQPPFGSEGAGRRPRMVAQIARPLGLVAAPRATVIGAPTIDIGGVSSLSKGEVEM